ncbi:MAG: DUF5752 family protein [Candidatus Altiarchaeia archaeon]
MQTSERAFVFHTSLELIRATDHVARNVKELLEAILVVEESSLFYHTHRYFRESPLTGEKYSSDYAQWAIDTLREPQLGEKLASIDMHGMKDMEAVRTALTACIDGWMSHGCRVRDVPRGTEFYFCKPLNIVMPTKYIAGTLEEFILKLEKASINSLYHHIFEARFRLGKNKNDYSSWIENALGRPDLANRIDELDFYACTLDESRKNIIRLINEDGSIKA